LPATGFGASAWPRLAALLAVVFWGLSFVATKLALRELSPTTLVFVRFALGAALLLGILAARRAPLVPPRAEWLPLMTMGLLGVFVHPMLQATALTMTTAIHTGWLIGVIPIWSALLAAIVLGERLGAVRIVGLAVGFAGVALVVSPDGSLGGVVRMSGTRGDLLVLLSTVNWAVVTVIGRATLQRLGPTRATAAATCFGLVLLAPLFLARSGWRELQGLDAAGWAAVLFLGFGCSGLGYLLWYGALEKLEASRVAAFLYLEPLVTLAAAAAVLHEPVTGTAVMGGMLVLAGVVLVQRRSGSALTE